MMKRAAQSLLWAAAMFGAAVAIANIVEPVIMHFTHGDAQRTQADAINIMWLFSPFLGLLAFGLALLVFTVPTCWQCLAQASAERMAIRRPGLCALAVLPVTAVLTWFCWKYGAPTDMKLGIDVGPDWRPQQHGFTPTRYLQALACQAPVSFFQTAYCDPGLSSRSRKRIVAAALILASFLGAVSGCVGAMVR